MRPEPQQEAAALRARLRHVYWLGGGSGAGKSTIARRLAAQHGLRLYATDAAMAAHDGRTTRHDTPFLSEFKAMSMDERWVNRSPETMLETFHWYRGEGFALIIEDLLRLPDEPRAIAEGFRLLPRLVKPLLTTPHHAVAAADARVPPGRVRQPGLPVGDRPQDQRSGKGSAKPAGT
jgi:hypothetical protein